MSHKHWDTNLINAPQVGFRSTDLLAGVNVVLWRNEDVVTLDPLALGTASAAPGRNRPDVRLHFTDDQPARIPFTEWDFEQYSSVAPITPQNTVPEPSFGTGTFARVGTNLNNTFLQGIHPETMALTGTSTALTGNIATNANNSAGFIFRTSTAGLENISVSWYNRWTGAAANRIRLQYTIDGTTWISFVATGPNAVNQIQQSSVFDNGMYINKNSTDWFFRSADFSAIPEVNNNPNFAVRFVIAHPTGSNAYVRANGAAGAIDAGANIRFDNVVFSHSPTIPVVATPTATPRSGTFLIPTDVTLATATDGATIHYTTDGSMPSTSDTVYTAPITMNSGTTTLRFIAVKDEMASSQVVSETYIITNTTLVNSIKELKSTATPGDGVLYRIPGSIILTVGNPPHDFRNQKYVQDMSGADREGIMIDDPTAGGTNIITTPLVPGDELIDLIGRVTLFQGMWRFTPIANVTKGTENNHIAPLKVTFEDIVNDPIRYQAVVVEVENVVFSGSGNLGSGGTVHSISDGITDFRFRNNFWQADYVATLTPIPHLPITMVGLVSAADLTNPTVVGASFITPRSWADFNFNPVATPASSLPAGDYFETQMVTLTTSTSDAQIWYTTNGDTPVKNVSTLYTTPISISQTTILSFIATKDSMDDSRIVSLTYRLPVVYNSIAALKANADHNDGILYRIDGSIVYNIGHPLHNHRYIQDVEGVDREGIVIDDPVGVITTEFVQGDQILNLVGTINIANGMWQIIPMINPTKGTTGITIEPLTVTLEEIINEPIRYQAVLVKVEDVVFLTSDNFTVQNRSYDITDGTAAYMFRTHFYGSDYLNAGKTTPFSPINLTGMVSSTNIPGLGVRSFITARMWSDFDIQSTDLYLPPRNLTATVEHTVNVKLDWSLPLPGGLFSHSTSNEMNSISIGEPGGFYVAQRFTPEQLIQKGVAGQTLAGISFMVDDTTCDFTIMVWVGGTWHPTIQNLRQPGTEVARQHYGLCPYPGMWVNIYLDTPVKIPVDRELWIGYRGEATGGYPAAVDDGPAFDTFGNIVNTGFGWITLLDMNDQANFNWMIRGAAMTSTGNTIHFGKGETTPAVPQMAMSNATTASIRYNTNRGNVRNEGLLGYDVYRSNNGATATKINSHLLTNRTFTDIDRPVGTFTYHVKAIYEGLTGIITSEPSMTTVVTFEVVLNPPHYLDSDIDGNDIILTWQAPQAHPHLGTLLHYNIFRDDDPLRLEFDKNATMFRDESVPKDQLMTYHIVAIYEEGPSENSTETSIMLPTIILNPPLNLTGSFNEDNKIVLTWEAPASGDGTFLNTYNIYRYGVTEPIAIGISGLTWIDNEITVVAGVWYRYYASANYEEGPSIRSYRAEFMLRVLNPPLNFVASLVSGNVKLDWQAPEAHTYLGDLVGYRIFRNGVALIPDQAVSAVTFTDTNIALGGRYEYYLKAVYTQGLSVATQTEVISEVSECGTTIEVMVTSLVGNYPNPFNPQTTIQFTLSFGEGRGEGFVRINVYNVRGQLVRTLINGVYGAGEHSVVWNGTDDHGRTVSSGIYFYSMQTDEFNAMRKMILMK
jgi:hypothetical protein